MWSFPVRHQSTASGEAASGLWSRVAPSRCGTFVPADDSATGVRFRHGAASRRRQGGVRWNASSSATTAARRRCPRSTGPRLEPPADSRRSTSSSSSHPSPRIALPVCSISVTRRRSCSNASQSLEVELHRLEGAVTESIATRRRGCRSGRHRDQPRSPDPGRGSRLDAVALEHPCHRAGLHDPPRVDPSETTP